MNFKKTLSKSSLLSTVALSALLTGCMCTESSAPTQAMYQQQTAAAQTKDNIAAYFVDANTEWESVGDGITRKILPYTDGLMGVMVKFDKGAIGKVHSHDVHDQLSLVVSGSFEVELAGEKRILKEGDAFLAGKNTPHGVVTLEQDSKLMDVFNPHRAGFVGGTPQKAATKSTEAPINAFFYNNSKEWESVGGGISRKILPYTEGLMGVLVNFDKGAIGKVHTHDIHDQLAICLKGSFEVELDGVKTIVKEGDAFLAGKGTPHGVVALEQGSQLLDTFNPYRASFVNKK